MDSNQNLSNTEIARAVEELDLLTINNQIKHPVLLIDDDKWIHRVICHYLREWGFNPLSAYDPIEGLAMAIKHRPALILLDIIMPEVKGDTILKMLKKIELTTEIPIIIISGNLNTDILGTTFKEGAAAYISKPIQQPVLLEKVKTAITPLFMMEQAQYDNVRV